VRLNRVITNKKNYLKVQSTPQIINRKKIKIILNLRYVMVICLKLIFKMFKFKYKTYYKFSVRFFDGTIL